MEAYRCPLCQAFHVLPFMCRRCWSGMTYAEQLRFYDVFQGERHPRSVVSTYAKAKGA